MHHLATVFTGTGADVYQPVGGSYGVFVVLNDNQRVAEIAQPRQGFNQAPVVALVQPNARFVKHVEHPGEASSNLGCQPDALRLATGK